MEYENLGGGGVGGMCGLFELIEPPSTDPLLQLGDGFISCSSL